MAKTTRVGKSLIAIKQELSTKEQCMAFLENLRWPDESELYKNLTRKGFKHDIAIHSDKQWVKGNVHTQGIDGFWAFSSVG